MALQHFSPLEDFCDLDKALRQEETFFTASFYIATLLKLISIAELATIKRSGR